MKKICTVSLLVLLCYSACKSGETKVEKIDFLVTTPLRKDTFVTRTYVCQIQAIQHIEMRAMEHGYLQKIFVDEGQLVKKGQLMFQILPTVYEAEMQKAQAEADFAKIQYENTKKLADSNIVSGNELAMVRATFEKAKAELAFTRVHLGFTEIRAPFAGLMDHFYVREGSLLEKGDLLTTLSDNSQMWVYFNVPEAEYLNYKAKVSQENLLQVHLLMANNQIFEYPGVVKTIEADFNHETGNIAFRATFPNPKRLIRHGETGNIEMLVPANNLLLIPQKATFEILEKKYVFVVGKDSIVHAREIIIGAEMPDIYAIKAGINEGDKIILEGLRKTKDKDKITYRYEDPNTVLSNLKVHAE